MTQRGPRARTILAVIVAVALDAPPLAADMSRGGSEVESGLLDPRPGAGAISPSGRRVTVVWHDVEGLWPEGFEEMSASVTGVFRDAGVELVWRQASAQGASATDGVEIPIVLLMRDDRPDQARRSALAATWRGGEPRTVWLYLGAFWRTLGRGELPPRLSQANGRWLARPIAHVVIHELVHALVPDREHTHGGVLKGVYGRSELTAPLSGIGALEVRGLLEGLASVAAQRLEGPSMSPQRF